MIIQFCDFFLNAKPDMILDDEQRLMNYPVLSNKFLISVLPKYKVSFGFLTKSLRKSLRRESRS